MGRTRVRLLLSSGFLCLTITASVRAQSDSVVKPVRPDSTRTQPPDTLSDPVTIRLTTSGPVVCVNYYLHVFNNTTFPLVVAVGKRILGTAPIGRDWRALLMSGPDDAFRGVIVRAKGGPPPRWQDVSLALACR